jgi:hypothetical protein
VRSQLDIAFFPELTGMDPKQGWIYFLFPVASTDIFGCGKDPGDDG